MSCGAAFEDFSRLTTTDLRRMLGSRRKLRSASAVVLHLEEGDLEVQLTRGKANLGNGEIVFMLCPGCGRRISVLRLLPDGMGAVCGVCLRRSTGARYLSQIG